MQESRKEATRTQQIVAVMWPSFLMAGIATIVFFTVFDPDIILSGSVHHPVSRMAAYSIGFFCFWVLTAGSSALTCYFQRPCHQFNKSN